MLMNYTMPFLLKESVWWGWEGGGGVDLRRVEPELPWGLLPPTQGTPHPCWGQLAASNPSPPANPLVIRLAHQQHLLSQELSKDSEALASSEHSSKLGVFFPSRAQAPGNTLPFPPSSHRC